MRWTERSQLYNKLRGKISWDFKKFIVINPGGGAPKIASYM